MRPLPLLLLLSACLPLSLSAGPKPEPLPAGVFRGLLAGDGRPLVFVALNDRMTLAYDEAGGSLLHAWRGKVVPLDRGTVAAPAAAPGATARFRPEGLEYHRRDARSPWAVRGPKGNIPVTVGFAGAGLKGGLPSLRFTLRLAGGARVSVEETPMFDDHYGDAGLFRNFEVKGLPPGDTLRLDLSGRGLPATWGGGGDGGLAEAAGKTFLVQSADGETPLKVTWSDPAAGREPARGGGW